MIEVVEKTFLLMEMMGRLGRPASLSDLAQQARLPKPTVHRVLRTLGELGYVGMPSRGSYVLTERLSELGRSGHGRDLRQLARPLLEELHRRFDETVNLGRLQGMSVHYVDVIETSQALRWIVQPGARDPFHTTALGRAIVAFLPPARREVLVRKANLRHGTHRPIRRRPELQRILEEARRVGWAAEEEETVAGVACFALPLAPWGEPLAAVSLSIPVVRLTPPLRRAIGRAFDELLGTAPGQPARRAAS